MSGPILDPRQDMTRISRRSFLWAGAALLGAGGAYTWLNSRSLEGGKPWPFRKAFEVNERISRSLGQGSAREFTAKEISTDARVNGDRNARFRLADWQLHLEGVGGPRVLTMEQIRAMPATEIIAELNCIEGWTRVIKWRGVRMTDLLKALGIPVDGLPEHVALETPGGEYYVGLDRESALHPQSILAYEMNGAPLTEAHGAPLRHILPIKYGYKQLKYVGLIRFTKDRPKDYWAERGYDWYGGF